MPKNELGRWIERELKHRGWSQSELARHSGLNQGHISRIINTQPKNDKPICGRKSALALSRIFETPDIYVLRLARIIKPPRRSRNFSTWLLGELLNKGLEQADLAKQADLDEAVIANLMRGALPTSDQIMALAEPLDIEVSQLARIAGLDTGLLDFNPTNDELTLLNEYRKLSSRQQKLLRDILATIKANREQ